MNSSLLKPRYKPTQIAFVFCLALAFKPAWSQSFSELIIFGDSLSDTGNLAIVNFPPPFFDNRISDGPLIVDLLASSLGKNANASEHLLGNENGLNYSVAGGNIIGSDPEDLSSQITAFLNRFANRADSNSAYLLFAGGNDIRGLRSITNSAVADAQIDAIVATHLQHMRRLYDRGARYFIVPNVVDVGAIPESLEREAADPGVTSRLTDYSQRYNQKLKNNLDAFRRSTSASVLGVDVYQQFNQILANPAAFGFSTATEGCFDPDERNIELECLLFGFERRVFFDSIHPSSRTNSIIAQPLIDVVLKFQTEVFATTPPIIIGPLLELLLSD